MKAIKIDDTGSVLIDTEQGFNVWVDVYKADDSELTADWNKYIFFLNNSEDMAIKAFQENPDNFIEATEIAIEYYEEHFNHITQ